MEPRQLAAFKASLVRLREELIAGGPAKIEPNRKDPSTVGIADEDEQALSEMLQTLASQRNKQQGELLSQIDRALGKIEREPDLVGLCEECEECEEEIDARRLKLMPYVTLCAECQQARDKKRGGARRSTTDFL
jgi:DnaK suppressor protein